MSWFPRRLSSANKIRTNANVDLPEVIGGLYSVAPVLGAAELVRASLSLTGAVQLKTTGFTNPDVPRQLKFTKTNNAVSGNVIIVGTDIADAVITETIALPGGADNVDSLNAYKTITSISYPALTAPGDWIKTGTTDVLGIPEKATYDNVIWATFDGAYNAHTISNNATVVSKNLITLTGATFDGAKIANMFIVTN